MAAMGVEEGNRMMTVTDWPSFQGTSHMCSGSEVSRWSSRSLGGGGGHGLVSGVGAVSQATSREAS